MEIRGYPGAVTVPEIPGCFYLTGNFIPCQIKTLCGMRTRAKQKYVAKATALGARVPQAELFVFPTACLKVYPAVRLHIV